MPALVFQDELGHSRSFEISRDTLTIGRMQGNDLVLSDPMVSRKHCAIVKEGAHFIIRELGSTFGTAVNNEKVVGNRRLVDRDVLRIGNTEITFLTTAPAAGVTQNRRIFASGAAQRVHDRLERAKHLADMLTSSVQQMSEDTASMALPLSLTDQIEDAQRALEDLEREHRLTTTLSQVGRLISCVTNLEQLLQLTLDQAISALEAERGFILLREGGKLVPRVSRGLARDEQKGELRVSHTISEKVAQDGHAILTVDAQIDPRFANAESIVAKNVRSVLCVPLRDKNLQTAGVIYVEGHPGRSVFTPEGLEFLESFASQAAVAIENAQLQERSEAELKLRQRFSRYFSDGVVTQIIEDMNREGAGTRLAGSSRVVTVLFTDIRNSTHLLGSLKPSEAVEMLNDYFTEIVAEVEAEEGTLDKFTGDGIMAFWGAPQRQPDHAVRAVRAALRMQARLPALRERWRGEQRTFAAAMEALTMGIGIHTGEVVVGDIGSPKRIEFTAIGDAVNVCARVQGVAQGGEVLCTANTLAMVQSIVRAQALPPVQVKGKPEPIALYRISALR